MKTCTKHSKILFLILFLAAIVCHDLQGQLTPTFREAVEQVTSRTTKRTAGTYGSAAVSKVSTTSKPVKVVSVAGKVDNWSVKNTSIDITKQNNILNNSSNNLGSKVNGGTTNQVIRRTGNKVAEVKSNSRTSNKLLPIKKKNGDNIDATGDHTVYKKGYDGSVYKYETYEQVHRNNYNPVKRYDGGKPDGSPGASHTNKKGEQIKTPHVQGKSVKEGVRPAQKDEIPKKKNE
ncbi:hypothetical protein V1387_04850 [Allomuricauda taeanensis]|uniref:hypothetical protein n=1 Tax=Flagellimonas taeanensis TaxID=1005926 RepID=UPI002E7BAAFC|nr:hypothetical protein [Allomuricauda taeanensis]MEE1962004.1 hypothetical protein [Allomuricauda taeanensis]